MAKCGIAYINKYDKGITIMKKLFSVVLIMIVPLLLTACGGSKPSAKIKSVEYVDSIPAAGGGTYSYDDVDIVHIVLDLEFDKSISSNLDTSSENYPGDIYAIVVEGAHFYYAGEELGREYGYWPEKFGDNHAKGISLFYLLPQDHNVDDLRFVYDGDVIGHTDAGIDKKITP
jgi:hypothetical protein